MSQPVSYVDVHSPDLGASSGFFTAVFGWQLQPFAAPDYLVAAHGDAPGVDTGLLPSRDGSRGKAASALVDGLKAGRRAVRSVARRIKG